MVMEMTPGDAAVMNSARNGFPASVEAARVADFGAVRLPLASGPLPQFRLNQHQGGIYIDPHTNPGTFHLGFGLVPLLQYLSG